MNKKQSPPELHKFLNMHDVACKLYSKIQLLNVCTFLVISVN